MGFWLSWSYLASQNWLLWLTLQARLGRFASSMQSESHKAILTAKHLQLCQNCARPLCPSLLSPYSHLFIAYIHTYWPWIIFAIVWSWSTSSDAVLLIVHKLHVHCWSLHINLDSLKIIFSTCRNFGLHFSLHAQFSNLYPSRIFFCAAN